MGPASRPIRSSPKPSPRNQAISASGSLAILCSRNLSRLYSDEACEQSGAIRSGAGGANPERHEYELYLAIEDIDHTRTKTKSPQTNGICERFHKTVLNEFYRVAFRKKVYRRAAGRSRSLDARIQRGEA